MLKEINETVYVATALKHDKIVQDALLPLATCIIIFLFSFFKKKNFKKFLTIIERSIECSLSLEH